MNEDRANRKLTAILSADVKGYSRLMGDDELSTIGTLKKYRELISTIIKQFKGRVVDSPGDNLLAEFGSVVDAVECAVKLQEDLKIQNEELPDNRKMEFRIGVNLGDVVEDDGRIYGDGVNIAARIEGLADSGGICISRNVYDQVKRKLNLKYEYLGEHQVKNIDDPVRVYKILMGTKPNKVSQEENSLEPASIEKMSYPLPDRPSIAILPFTNMSGDTSQEYIGDGLSENIISALSVSSEIFVIARNSTFTYKGKPVKVQQVAEDLGIQYVLEGSIQKSGNQLRVTAQLIDALTGHHLWAEVYDREMRDFFDLQDEITKKILVSLQVELTQGEHARVIAKSTENLEALKYFIKGIELFFRYNNKEEYIKAREYFKTAIKIDPKFVGALSLLAQTHLTDVQLGWSDSPVNSINEALDLSQKALELDEKNPVAHTVLGNIFLNQRQHEKAITELKNAIKLNPNFSTGLAILGCAMFYVGQFEEAIIHTEKAYRINPKLTPVFLVFLNKIYIHLGRYEEALEICEKAGKHARRGEIPMWMIQLAFSWVYQELGREEEARTYMSEALKTAPYRSLESYTMTSVYKNPVHQQREIDALRKAGMPERATGEVHEKPSIAVLPFINMSNDPDQEYFSDGMTEDIITDLSKISGIVVIARNSSFTYKGKSVKVQQVAKDLGVQFVLEGSVRRGGNRLRITVQLIDGETGNHLWAERYDRELKEIFEVQDEVTQKVVSELAITLTTDEYGRLDRKHTRNFKTYELSLRARKELYGLKKENYVKAIELEKQVIELDPNFAGGYARLSLILGRGVRYGFSSSPSEDMEKAFNLAQKAVEIDESYAVSYFALADCFLMRRMHDDAIAAMYQAIRILPGDAFTYLFLGWYLHWAGRGKAVIEAIKKAQQLDPRFQYSRHPGYFDFMGCACFTEGLYEESIENWKKSIDRYGPEPVRQAFVTASYSELGREKEAMEMAQNLLKTDPKFSISSWNLARLYKNPEDTERLLNALRKAGVK